MQPNPRLLTFKTGANAAFDGDPYAVKEENPPIPPDSVYYFVQDASVTGIQTRLSDDHDSKPRVLKTAIAVCLIVLMLLALVHVADAHSTASASDHCPLCVVMHSVVPFLIVAIVMALIRIGTHAPELLEVRALIRYWHPNLFTRPPPAGC
jgi:hypothetical protein